VPLLEQNQQKAQLLGKRSGDERANGITDAKRQKVERTGLSMNELLRKVKAIKVPEVRILHLDHLGRHELKEIER
jgi:hypothetical protein